jgi:hypothetical protein
MILTRVRSLAENQNWGSIVLDLFIVIIGFFSGLQIDEWWQNNQDSEKEQAYLQELIEDFEGNKELLELMLEEGELVINDMIALAEQGNLETPSLPVEELDEKLSSLQSMPAFIPITRAYDSLTGSGELRLITQREVKTGLADYYSFAKVIELVQATHEMQLVTTFLPYLSENTEFARLLVSWQDEDDFPLPEPKSSSGIELIVPTRKFRNIVTEKYYAMRDIFALHTSMKEINDEILALLKAEIEG